ncbi:MAG TPA: hypothetical protein VF630_08495 [Hymenobacter sp.]|jgi:uncharacterized membrane protein
MLHSSVSGIHLLAVLVALVAGTHILATPKSTPRHRRSGWLYVGSMGVVLLTAFRMYYLFGRFGVVHWGAVASGAALTVGTGAAVCRKVVPAWRRWHYLGMGVSVTGLYAALVVESTYRFFPAAYFWWVTLGPAAAVFVLGGWLLRQHFPSRSAPEG